MWGVLWTSAPWLSTENRSSLLCKYRMAYLPRLLPAHAAFCTYSQMCRHILCFLSYNLFEWTPNTSDRVHTLSSGHANQWNTVYLCSVLRWCDLWPLTQLHIIHYSYYCYESALLCLVSHINMLTVKACSVLQVWAGADEFGMFSSLPGPRETMTWSAPSILRCQAIKLLWHV